MKKLILLVACAVAAGHVWAQGHNTLSPKEKKEGWVLLFDGKTTTGWHNFKTDKAGANWKAVDGALTIDPSIKAEEGKGDLVTNEEYENYEFSVEWKIDSCGNSGIIFNTVESDKYKYIWQTGPEMQVLDNTCHPDAKIIKHRAGDLYDLIKCSEETVKPAGQWNHARIVTNKAHYEFYLNGKKVVEFTMHTPEWDAMVQGSKFKSMPDFGKATKGHIALQDHGNKVWFRNIKIRKL